MFFRAKWHAPVLLAIILLVTPGLGRTAPKMQPVSWATKSVMRTPDAALYSPSHNVIFVTNINGRPTTKDKNGFISRLSPDGKILDLQWVTGLHAPKGMAITGNTLYVSDIDTVIKIDVNTGTIISRHEVPLAKYLNDVTVDSFGGVYVSDQARGSNTIYKLKSGQLTQWLTHPRLKDVNALAMQGNSLIAGVNGGILYRINIDSKSIANMADVSRFMKQIDGIVSDMRGGWYVSDGEGRVVHVDYAAKATLVLDRTEERIPAADIAFVPGKNLLVVPTYDDNRIITYQLK